LLEVEHLGSTLELRQNRLVYALRGNQVLNFFLKEKVFYSDIFLVLLVKLSAYWFCAGQLAFAVVAEAGCYLVAG
jgi:hypothetical protein